ncbi:MAG: CBS domain-containing protein [Gammaproteobacteria bacterium]
MKKIKEVLDAKGRDVLSIAPEASVYEAVTLMAERGVGALLVMEGDRFVGLVGERDCLLKVMLEDRSPRETEVKQLMAKNILCVKPEQTVEEGMALMTDKRIRHLPVVKGDRVEGIISIGDLVKAIIADQQFVIKQLEHYVTS